jgi:hypothetical protein
MMRGLMLRRNLVSLTVQWIGDRLVTPITEITDNQICKRADGPERTFVQIPDKRIDVEVQELFARAAKAYVMAPTPQCPNPISTTAIEDQM